MPTLRPLPEAWSRALYGDDGFYRRAAGPAAHFATSAQGLPGVDELLAECVVELCHRHDLARIVEIGCGRGELLTLIASMAPELELTGVDVVERPADLPASINWTQSPGGAALPETVDCLTDSLVFAHEWLDVVPCEIAVRESSQWHVVGVDQDGSLQPHRSLTDAERQWCERFWPSPGDVMEIGLSRDQAYAGLRARLRSGLLVCVDYGHLAGGRPPERTLVGYRDGSICQPRFDGSTDLTAHVAVDSLGADRVTRQRDIALELLEPPPRPGHSLASTDPATYLAALRRRSAWTTLTAPTGLGGFWWTLEPVDGSATNSSAAAAN